MAPVNLLVIGCGMMGARHVRGLGELERVAPGTIRLVGLCDSREEVAQRVAAEAEGLLGSRPAVYAGVDQALAAQPDLQLVDVVTDPRSHDGIVVPLLEAGLHVLCEKPLAVTVARGQRMVDAAVRSGRKLAVAENNRHDPMNRLARACIDGGLIGDPHFALQLSIMPGGGIVATAWRHRLAMGGVLLDVAIHQAYMLEYLLGPLESVCARAQLVQGERHGKEFDGTEVDVQVDAEDAFSALLEFAGGAQGHWTVHFASVGEGAFRRLVLGTAGTLDAPSDRSGQPVVVRCGDGQLSGDDLRAQLGNYCLPEIETRLFGERPARYELEGVATDRKLIAAEVYDLVAAIRSGGAPEADGAQGLRAIAIIYAVLESALCGRSVRVEEVLGGSLHAYQDMVEAAQ